MGAASKKLSADEPYTTITHQRPGAFRPKALRTLPVQTSLEAGHPADDNQIMSTPVTREELDAKLLANATEIKLVAYEMHADIGALRAENQAQFSAIQALIETQTAKSEARFTALDAKIDGVEKSLEGKIVGLEGKIDGVEKSLEGKIVGLEGKIVGIEGKIVGLEGKIDGQRSALGMLQWVIIFVATLAGLEIAYMQMKPAIHPTASINTIPLPPPG
jgi:hypothetical protein